MAFAIAVFIIKRKQEQKQAPEVFFKENCS